MYSKRRRVVFACGTEFQVFVAYILARTEYADAESILLLHSNHRTAHILANARASATWSKVISVSEAGSEFDICAEADGFDTVLIFFSWGFPALNRIYASTMRRGDTIHLADEGLLTYGPRAAHEKWLAAHPDHERIADGYDYQAVSEIWLITPTLFLESTHARLQRIDVARFMDLARRDAQIATDFGRVFSLGGVASVDARDIVYFRQYFSAFGALAEKTDAHLDSEILATLSGLPIVVKDHPGHRNGRYAEPQRQLQYAGPYEAFVLDRQIAGQVLPCIFVSPISSALINSAALGVRGTYVFLYKILEQYCNWAGPDHQKLLAGLRATFPDCSFFVPETWEDFAQVVAEWRSQYRSAAAASGSLRYAFRGSVMTAPSFIPHGTTARSLVDVSKYPGSSGGVYAASQPAEILEQRADAATPHPWSRDLRALNAFLLDDQQEMRRLTDSSVHLSERVRALDRQCAELHARNVDLEAQLAGLQASMSLTPPRRFHAISRLLKR